MKGPTGTVRRALIVALAMLGAAGCTLLATLDEHATGTGLDAGSDATTDAPGAALTLDIAFHELTLPPKGVPFQVKLKVVRSGGAPTPVTVTVKGTPNVSAPPVLLLANESEGSLAITVGDDPAVETARLEVTAKSNDATSAPQELVVKIAGAPGTFDTTLGGTGVISPDVTSTGDAVAFGMAVGADGTIVLAGTAAPPASTQPAFVALRLKPNGTPDPSFGTGGLVFLPFTATAMATGIALEPSGAVVLAGNITPGPSLFAVARLLPDGGIDTSFGNGGSFVGGVDGGNVSLSGVVSFDGGVVATGGAALPDGDHVAFARVPPGALDVAPIGAGKERGTAIVLTRSGQLVATGIRDPGGAIESRSGLVKRAARDGGADESFGTKGTVAVPEAVLNAVAEEPGGSFVVGGGWFQTSTTFKTPPTMLVRLLASGGLDPSFGNAGRAVVDAGLEATGVAIQSDAKIAAAGSVKTGFTLAQAAVLRFTSSGALDPTFGGTGIVPLHPASTASQATAIAIQPDGRIVVAGHVRQGAVERFFVARVWP
jgi:uncharacterized delta-60 repeat protein